MERVQGSPAGTCKLLFVVCLAMVSFSEIRIQLRWNLLVRTPWGPAVLSFIIERLSSFRGDFL